MGSTFIWVLFAIIVRKGSYAEQDDDFRPTPIPLISWSGEKLDPAGTLQEFIRTDIPPTVAAIPAHYWEDALRHSVYLTLVRDKIDQLIAKGTIISPDSKPENNISKEVDDHDLWEKIKAAPFDRVKEDPIPPGDVIILARGKLLQEKNGFRFTELDEKCNKNNCTQSVKAYWSVKRVRQGETAPGKYHYELTFSVTSQAPRKVKKPYENPVRTFTIRENDPTTRPLAQTRNYRRHSERPQRAIWFHKNIVPSQNHHSLPQTGARVLDRIFSSLFSDDDNYDDVSYRRKPNAYIPPVHQQQHSKVGYVGDREQYHQKKMIPYPMKSQSFRYNRPPLQAPPVTYVQHPHLDLDQGGINSHPSLHLGNRYFAPNPVKPTKQTFLPTPITGFPLLKEATADVPVKSILNATDFTTKEPEIITTTAYKIYNHKQTLANSAYFSDNIRPPIYNAPPGVFTTMDKKPFKPMPPLKLTHSSKPFKNIPLDFRPSPQILDTSYTDTNSSIDTVFRPITLNFSEYLNNKKGPKNNRKPTLNKKPSKKHGNVKPQRITTISPDIITAHAETEEDDEIQWAEILGAFTKTTPMASEKDREIYSESELFTTTTATPTKTTETPKEKSTINSTTTSTTTTTTTTTTPKPRRTRPPPQFTKPEKVRKHKRITTTTSTTTTVKPTQKTAVKISSNDLMPQASSAATSGANSVWANQHKEDPTKTNSTSTTTTTTTSTSTTPGTTPITTTSSNTAATVVSESLVVTTQPKSKNRFRQSTLMHKGTSVNHDKWSTNTTLSTSQNQNLLRRKASKFQGYLSWSIPPTKEAAKSQDDKADQAFNSNQESASTVQSVEDILKSPKPTHPTVDSNLDISNNAEPDDKTEDDVIEIVVEKENDVHDSKDDNEFIFQITSPKSNDDLDNNTSQLQPTAHTVIPLLHSIAKNNTKCKKKNHQNPTTTENLNKTNEINTITTSPLTTTTASIFEELFGGFTMDDITENYKVSQSTTTPEPIKSESVKYEQYIPIDDDIEDFLHSLDHKDTENDNDDKSDEEYEEESDDEDSPFNNEDNLDSRDFNGEYYDDNSEGQVQESEGRPYSLLELMAME